MNLWWKISRNLLCLRENRKKYNFIGIVYMLEKCVQLFGTEGRAFFNGDFSVAIPSRKSVRLVAGWKERRKRFWRSFCMVDLPMRYFANGSPFVALAVRTSTRTMSYHAWLRVFNGECFLYFLTISHLLAVLAFIDKVGRFYVCVCVFDERFVIN